MATPARRPDDTLENQLASYTREFDFNQAVKILEALRPGCNPFATGDDPTREALSIKSTISLTTPTSDIESLQFQYDDRRPPFLTVNFIGIAGVQGPLPVCYTEIALDRIRNKDYAMRDFLDIFNHRLAGLWHRMRIKVVVGLAQLPPKETAAGKIFMDLTGLESKYLQDKIAIPDRRLFHFAPLIWHRPRTLCILQQIVNRYFNVTTVAKPLEGAWQTVDETECTQIGSMIGQYNRLGGDVVLGRKMWNQTHGVRLHLTNLDWNTYFNFLPNQSRHAELVDLIHFYVGYEVKVDLVFTVLRKYIPPTLLGKNTFLGFTTWIGRAEYCLHKGNPSITLATHLRSKVFFHSA